MKEDMPKYVPCYVSPTGANCRMFDFFTRIPTEVYQASFTNVDNKAVAEALSCEDDRQTIQVFFHNHLNINAASKALGIHRNTLNYRIDRLKKLTGLDLRHLCDAFIFYALMHKLGG